MTQFDPFVEFRMNGHAAIVTGGAIFNISSLAGGNRNARMAAYGASNAAENHLTRNIAFDLGPKKHSRQRHAPGGYMPQRKPAV